MKTKKNAENTTEEEYYLKKYGTLVDNQDLAQKAVRRGRMLDRYEYQHDPELYQSAPDPDSYTTFEDYEEALLN